MYQVTSKKGNEFEKWLPTAFILQIKYYSAEKLNTAFDNFRVVDILFRNDSKTISCAKTHNEIGYLNFERIILKPNFYCAFKRKENSFLMFLKKKRKQHNVMWCLWKNCEKLS